MIQQRDSSTLLQRLKNLLKLENMDFARKELKARGSDEALKRRMTKCLEKEGGLRHFEAV